MTPLGQKFELQIQVFDLLQTWEENKGIGKFFGLRYIGVLSLSSKMRIYHSHALIILGIRPLRPERTFREDDRVPFKETITGSILEE